MLHLWGNSRVEILYGLFRSTAHISTSIKGMKNWGGWGWNHVQGISGRFILPKLKILLCVSCSGGRCWILCEVNRDKRMLSFTCQDTHPKVSASFTWLKEGKKSRLGYSCLKLAQLSPIFLCQT